MEVIVKDEKASPEGECIYEKSSSSGNLSDKDEMIEDVLALLLEKKFTDETMNFAVRLALDEGLVNAMRHGNKLQADKIASTHVFDDKTSYSILISDEGEGFEPYDVPDPDDEESLYLERGRGVLIMKHYFDRVEYFNGGSQLLLVKNK